MKRDFEESQGKSGKVGEPFLWPGEIYVFQIKSGKFLTFLKLYGSCPRVNPELLLVHDK